MASRNKTFLYIGLGALAWWYYQKSKGNTFFGTPATALAVTPTAATNAAVAALASAGVTNPTAAQVSQAVSQIAAS